MICSFTWCNVVKQWLFLYFKLWVTNGDKLCDKCVATAVRWLMRCSNDHNNIHNEQLISAVFYHLFMHAVRCWSTCLRSGWFVALACVSNCPPECRGAPATTVRPPDGPSTPTTAATSAARRATTRTTVIATVGGAGAGTAVRDLVPTPVSDQWHCCSSAVSCVILFSLSLSLSAWLPVCLLDLRDDGGMFCCFLNWCFLQCSLGFHWMTDLVKTFQVSSFDSESHDPLRFHEASSKSHTFDRLLWPGHEQPHPFAEAPPTAT